MATDPDIKEVLDRLVRIETKLSQFMLHMGLDPATRKYDHPRIQPGEDGLKVPKVWRFGKDKTP